MVEEELGWKFSLRLKLRILKRAAEIRTRHVSAVAEFRVLAEAEVVSG